MTNKLVPVGQFLDMVRGKAPAVSRPAPAPAYAGDMIDNCAFVAAKCRQREFGNRNCVVLAMVGPNGGTRAVGAMDIKQTRDLISELLAACHAVETNQTRRTK